MSRLKKLQELYTNPEIGFTSKQRFSKKLKSLGNNFTSKEINDFFKTLQVDQVFKQPVQSHQNNITITACGIGMIQADLIDMGRPTREGPQYKYILTCVDVYSRYAWTFPIKKKSPDEILPHIKSVYHDIAFKAYPEAPIQTPLTFTCDDGSEFKSGCGNHL